MRAKNLQQKITIRLVARNIFFELVVVRQEHLQKATFLLPHLKINFQLSTVRAVHQATCISIRSLNINTCKILSMFMYYFLRWDKINNGKVCWKFNFSLKYHISAPLLRLQVNLYLYPCTANVEYLFLLFLKKKISKKTLLRSLLPSQKIKTWQSQNESWTFVSLLTYA